MKTTGKKRLSKKEIMRRRKRERRLYICTAVFATLCVFVFIGVVLMIRSSPDDSARGGNWIVEDGQVQIAAPAGGAVIEATQKPSFPDFPVSEASAEPFATPAADIAASPAAEPSVDATEEPTAAPAAEETVSMPSLDAESARTLITITAVGDCTLGGDYNTSAHERFEGYADKYGYDYFLENVRYIFEADDLTIVNLEGPLTTSNDKRSGRTFNFKGDPEYVQILSGSSVELAGLANNHALDFGISGLEETAAVLDAAGVGYCGYKSVWHGDVSGVDVTCLSVTEWDYTTAELAEMLSAERGDCDLLIVMIHWGEEREYSATDSQKKYGHALIDAGADLVLGSHSHVIGGVEEYNGKYIVYGLGNFCFGGNRNPSDKDCLIFQQTFELTVDGEIANAGISIIPCSSSSLSDSNDYRPTPLAGAEAARALRKIARYCNLDYESIIWRPEMNEYLAVLQ